MEWYKSQAVLDRYFDKKKEMREDAMQYAACSSSEDIVAVPKGDGGIISESNKMENMHPAFDIFMEWREIAIQEETKQNEQHMVAYHLYITDTALYNNPGSFFPWLRPRH